ncbi:MAG: SUMF1/EgtB/PvdO family nonheme iron enzyme [Bacteroidota bacterium]
MKLQRTILLVVLTATLISAGRPSPKLKDFFVYVPSGYLQVDQENAKSINGFYMFSTEVTNSQYREYLNDLEERGNTEELQIAKVQEDNWKQIDGYNEPMTQNYFNHPAFDDYPVVNVSHEAAENYCKWLSEKYSEKASGWEVHVRLPKKLEWSYAAKGGHTLAPYPWGGYYVKNAKDCYLLNFSTPDEDRMADGGLYTVNATAYFPNDYGLYNTSGNVAEMIDEEGIAMGGSWMTEGYKSVTTTSEAIYSNATPDVGFRPILTVIATDKPKAKFNPNKLWKKIF